MNFRFITLSVLLLLGYSCGNNAIQVLKNQIKRKGFMMFQNPLDDSRIGTLIGAGPDSQSFVSHSNTCFRDNELFPGLKKSENVDLPSIARTIYIEGDSNSQLMDVLGTGVNPILKGTDFDKIHSIELSFENVSIEYIDLEIIKNYYQKVMSNDCKQFLDTVGFISKLLKVGQTRFVFRDQTGNKIGLSEAIVESLFELELDTEWKVENLHELVINSPKYMGFQLGQLKLNEDSVQIFQSTNIRKNRYQFKEVESFENNNSILLEETDFRPQWFIQKSNFLELHGDYK